MKFTKSDLKDNHIVVNRHKYKTLAKTLNLSNFNDNLIFKSENYNHNDIMEVWEFDKLVWKREEKPVEILDDKEKKWLNNFIKSTNIKVNYIVKYGYEVYKDREFLKIEYNINGNREKVTFPYFKENTMYKGMEVNKAYTLKELGLE